jgi:demethylmenaquinone methyltransferase/2-methoxy-6-polyprenyl-1,4-benzoquinol methylase
MGNNKVFSKKDRKSEVGPMFDSIAWRYDFLNHLLSFGIDRSWRKKAVSIISETHKNPNIIDVATGTGDLAFEAVTLDPLKITGIDISEKMLDLGRRKAQAKGLTDLIEFIKCDSENICFEDNTFDVAMVAFGVRNFPDPLKGLCEMRRVLRKGGLAMVLEFSKPDGHLFRHAYDIYFRDLLPPIGGFFSKNMKAYRYLNESVMGFPSNEEFIGMMGQAGFSGISLTRLTKGIASIYTGIKD